MTTYLKATGVFAGLKIPASLRGHWVTIANGKVRAYTNDIKRSMRLLKRGEALLAYVPKKGRKG